MMNHLRARTFPPSGTDLGPTIVTEDVISEAGALHVVQQGPLLVVPSVTGVQLTEGFNVANALVEANARRLWRAEWRLTTAGAGARWMQLHDAAALPGVGAIPRSLLGSLLDPAAAGSVIQVTDWSGVGGLPLANGAVLAVSGVALTLATAAIFGEFRMWWTTT